MGWWNELWNPGQAAALEYEERLNAAKIKANAQQNSLEAYMSLQLTEADNNKMIMAIGIITFALIFYIHKQS